MSNQEKVFLLEEMMELDEGMLSEETELSQINEWDSMAALSLIVLLDEKFGKKITASDIRSFKAVSDVISCMN